MQSGLSARYHSLVAACNNKWHERSLRVYMVIVLAHWAEHLVQAFQIFVLKWPRPQSLGLIGHWFPWAFKSELLHYAYALVMLIGLWVFRSGFKGRSFVWWQISLVIQFWHHIEHLLLQVQYVIGQNLFNSPVPISIVQLWILRVELHLFYNGIVFVPMLVAMYYHLFPSEQECAQHTCTCAWSPHKAA